MIYHGSELSKSKLTRPIDKQLTLSRETDTVNSQGAYNMKTIIKNATGCIYANLNGIETEGRTLKDCKAALARLLQELEPIKYLDRKEEKSLPLDTLKAALDAKTMKLFIQTATAAAEELAALKARKQVLIAETPAPELSASEPATLPPVLAAIADNMDKVEAAASADSALAIFTPQSVEEIMYPVTLESCKIEINMYMERAASSALHVGGLLVTARGLCTSQDEFLQWAAENVQIGKAQAYKLIAIHKEFGEDARFDGVAMRVLSMLSGQPEAVKIKAVELAAAGKLDSKSAEVLTGKVIDITPIKKPEQVNAAAAILKAQEPEDASFTAAPEDDCPFDTGVAVTGAHEAPSSDAQSAPESIEELEHTIELLNTRIAELSKPLPALLQFSNERMHTRLGLDPTEAKDNKTVRAAYRVLAAIWSKDSAPDSFKLITEAKDELTSNK